MGEKPSPLEAELSGGIEGESSPEIPTTFDHAIVLGCGTIENPDGSVGLTADSKIRVLAAGLLAAKGRIGELILTGGKTAGPERPSEAEAMKQYLLKKFPVEKYPKLRDFSIRLEEASVDTVENAKLVAEMLQGDSEGSVLLVTSDYHMLRASRNFQNQGLSVEEMPAEEIVSERSGHHKRYIREYLRSFDTKKKRVMEAALRGMMRIDPSGKLLTDLARRLRSG